MPPLLPEFSTPSGHSGPWQGYVAFVWALQGRRIHCFDYTDCKEENRNDSDRPHQSGC